MEINETQLRKLIERIMELTLELTETSKQEILVVLTGNDYKQLATVLTQLTSDNVNITAVADSKYMEDEELGKLLCKDCRRIIQPAEALSGTFNYSKIIFPAMPRDILAKCALCIPDTYEVAIVQKAFEEAVPVALSKNALEPFTGKEPVSYQERILGYIKNLLEYGIEIELDT